ncbi:hypothetical protein AK88_05662, partial [Plasmodium fragile]
MAKAALAHALADWLVRAGTYDQHKYEEMVWNKTKDVMQEFVQYMETADIISYAANCDNKGWDHPSYPTHGPKYVPSKVGDKIVCVLMVAALFFMNWGTTAARIREKEDDTSASITEHLRCAIVHMFSAVLNESVCKSTWGTFYAWKTMDNLGEEGGWGEGLIQQSKCGRNISLDLKIRELKLNEQVKTWLGQNSTLQQRIKEVKGTNTCETPWKAEWKIADFLNKEEMQHKEHSEITAIVAGLKDRMKELLTEIRKQVDQDVQKRHQATTGKSENDGKHGQAATKPATPSPQQPT